MPDFQDTRLLCGVVLRDAVRRGVVHFLPCGVVLRGAVRRGVVPCGALAPWVVAEGQVEVAGFRSSGG